MSMQQAFEEFARLFATDDSKATKIVEQLVMRKIKEAIEGKERPRRHDRKVGELDHDSLYNLIEEGTTTDEESV